MLRLHQLIDTDFIIQSWIATESFYFSCTPIIAWAFFCSCLPLGNPVGFQFADSQLLITNFSFCDGKNIHPGLKENTRAILSCYKNVPIPSPFSTPWWSLSGLCMAHMFYMKEIHYKKTQMYKLLGLDYMGGDRWEGKNRQEM